MKIYIDKKSVEIPVRKLSKVGQVRGLMFRSKNTENLFFEFPSPNVSAIHSLFVFFPFLAVWLSDDNYVLQTKVVKPFTLLHSPSIPSSRLIEVPLNEKNSKLVRLLDDKGKV